MAPLLRRRGRGRGQELQRVIYGLIALSFGLCMVTTMVFMGIKNPSGQLPCSSCFCDCSYRDFLPISCQLISYNSSVEEIDPEMIEEIRKNRSALIKEELDLIKIVSEENMQHHESLMETIEKSSSQYQKEAENCNIGVRTCEQARERAEEELVKELKLTALWQTRAEMLAPS